MTEPRAYLFVVEDECQHTNISLHTKPQDDIEAMDLVLIAMKSLNALAELCPLAQPKIQAALKALDLDRVYDPDVLN